MNKRIHILMLTPGFPVDESDTSCIPPLQIYIKCLSELPNIHVSVCSMFYPLKDHSWQWNGIEIRSIYKRGPLSKLNTWYNAFKEIKALHAKESIHIIHGFWLSDPALVGRWIARNLKLPFLCTAMGQDVLKGNRYLNWIKKDFPIVTLSKYHQRKLSDSVDIQSDIIPWGIDDRNFSKNDHTTVYDLLFVGNLIPLKKVDVFIEVHRKLLQKKPLLKALVIGDGPLLDQYKTITTAEKLNIKFTGKISREEVINCMKRSHILVHPSSYESFGYVILEALASGMKIVTFDVGISKEIGAVHVVESVTDMIATLSELLDEDASRDATIPITIAETIDMYLKKYHELTD